MLKIELLQNLHHQHINLMEIFFGKLENQPISNIHNYNELF